MNGGGASQYKDVPGQPASARRRNLLQSSVKKPTLNAAVAFKCQCSEFCMFTRKNLVTGKLSSPNPSLEQQTSKVMLQFGFDFLFLLELGLILSVSRRAAGNEISRHRIYIINPSSPQSSLVSFMYAFNYLVRFLYV